MELNRKPYQGVFNIIKFNWPFYVVAVILVLVYILVDSYLPSPFQFFGRISLTFGIFTTIVSLIISYYIYDISDLYALIWLRFSDNEKVLTINAGFDETSDILIKNCPSLELSMGDFYDPRKHTEASIKRARKAYPPKSGTIQVSTECLNFDDKYFDKSIAILSAHEIRDDKERTKFFAELSRVTKSTGRIYVTEHLRDVNNFLAYSIGFVHFLSKKTWLNTFKKANLTVEQEIKTTPFITTFVLQINDPTS